EEPGTAAQPVRFAAGAHQAVFPAQVFREHIFLPVRVNGGDEAWFFFDTGAGMSIVSSAWAQKAGLTVEGTIGTKGSGAGSASMGLAKNVAMEMPGVQIPPATIAVWDLSAILPMLGRHWDGVLGYDIISRVVARVDYEHQQIILYDPATFVANPNAAALPVSFGTDLGNMPIVHAKILLPGRAPVEVQCAVDSGANGFHLTTPFAN